MPPLRLSVCLPWADSKPGQRQARLDRVRAQYAYCALDDPTNLLAPIAAARTFPLSEQYDLSWAVPYIPLLVRSKAREWWSNLEEFASRRSARRGKTATYATFHNRWFQPSPAVGDYATDERLVLDRLQGPNPLELKRVVDFGDVVRLLGDSDAPLAEGQERASQAHARGALYQVDYALLLAAQWPGSVRDSRWRPRYLPTPHALFWQSPDDVADRTLRPLAIRVDPESPVFRPGDGAGWEMAKLYLRVADLNAHIMGTHLYATHCVLEPFALSTPRQLSENHPIHVLLAPHLRFTLAVNFTNTLLLRNPRQVYASIYAGDLPITRRIIIAASQRTTFPELALPADLDKRGMADAPVDYAYRDDALLHWAAISRFVRAYLDLFYADDAAVAADVELAAFIAELGAKDGGALAGLEEIGAQHSREALAQLLTQVLFTAGPGHAAVHFSQPDFHSAPAAYPAAAWALGHLGVAQAVLQRFSADLRAVEQVIVARNEQRRVPYLYLLPSRVPNSVNL